MGTLLGQGLVLLTTPWLARQYTPEDFGTLALLLTVTNLSTAVACARYDLALPSSSDDDVVPILHMACLVASIFAGIYILFLGIVSVVDSGPPLTSPFNNPWLIGASIFLVGMQQLAIGIQTRERRYEGIGALRFGQAGLFVLLAAISSVGLCFAHAISYAIALPAVIKRLVTSPVRFKNVLRVARERKDFPLLSMPGAVLDVVGYSACIWIIVHFYGAHDAGQYSQIQRLVGAPLMLLGMSIGPILLRVGADATMDPKIIHLLIRQLSLIIFPAGLAVVAAIALVGEPLLRWMLGEQWRVEAAFVVPITVAVTVRACVSPLSAILISLRRFDLALGWQITYFLSSLGVLSISARYLNFSDFVLVYAAHEFLLYSIYLSLIARAVRKSSCAPYSV